MCPVRRRVTPSLKAGHQRTKQLAPLSCIPNRRLWRKGVSSWLKRQSGVAVEANDGIVMQKNTPTFSLQKNDIIVILPQFKFSEHPKYFMQRSGDVRRIAVPSMPLKLSRRPKSISAALSSWQIFSVVYRHEDCHYMCLPSIPDAEIWIDPQAAHRISYGNLFDFYTSPSAIPRKREIQIPPRKPTCGSLFIIYWNVDARSVAGLDHDDQPRLCHVHLLKQHICLVVYIIFRKWNLYIWTHLRRYGPHLRSCYREADWYAWHGRGRRRIVQSRIRARSNPQRKCMTKL
jgi:hypothetical protein